jgi:hypothetical protein
MTSARPLGLRPAEADADADDPSAVPSTAPQGVHLDARLSTGYGVCNRIDC